MTDDIRTLIREVLAEELNAHQGSKMQSPPNSSDEEVTVPADGDLTAFVQSIVERSKNQSFIDSVKMGRHRFHIVATTQATLVPTARTIASGSVAAPNVPVLFEKGLVTEKQIAALPEDSLIQATKRVTFTPLALDELRRRRIRMERKMR